MLFPDERARAACPVIAITGTNGKTTVTRMIAHIYSTMQQYVGMTTTDGIYFDGCAGSKGDCSGPRSAEAVLQHPDVEVAVLETARGGILRSGLAFDQCTGRRRHEHQRRPSRPRRHRQRPRRLARVKQVVIESVARERLRACSTPTTRSSPRWPRTAPAR